MSRLDQPLQNTPFIPHQTNILPKEGSQCPVLVYDSGRHSQLLSAIQFIEENISQNLKIKDIAGHVYMSESNFARLFRFVFGVAPYQYITKRKIDVSAQMLRESDHSVSSIAYQMGFSDIASFSRAFKQVYKLSPREYRNNGN